MTDNEVSKLSPEAIRRSRAKLLTLIAIAFVPIFIAYSAYFYFPAMAPTGTTNQGELVNPPVAGGTLSPAIASLSTWSLIQPLTGECDDKCRELMYLSRQIVTGLGKNTSRVTRVLLVDAPQTEAFRDYLNEAHGDLLVIEGDDTLLNRITSERPMLFLMDPNSNIMLFYSLDKAGKPMLNDIKHLLRVSNIG